MLSDSSVSSLIGGVNYISDGIFHFDKPHRTIDQEVDGAVDGQEEVVDAVNKDKVLQVHRLYLKFRILMDLITIEYHSGITAQPEVVNQPLQRFIQQE